MESVYSNQSMVTQATELADPLQSLEALCRPANVSLSPTKPKRNVIDYTQHVASKAPCAPKILRMSQTTATAATNKTSMLERTKQYMAQLPDKKTMDVLPEYLQQNKLIIQRFHEQQTSLYTQKLTSGKALLSNSAECVVFRPPPSARPVQQSLLRQTLSSAPYDNANQTQKTIKIYLSDKQSADMSEFGHEFPCPPANSPAEGM